VKEGVVVVVSSKQAGRQAGSLFLLLWVFVSWIIRALSLSP